MAHHLVILKSTYLQHILQGRKTTECRLSRTRRPPFGLVDVGDTLWLKRSGGPVLAKAEVRQVEYIHPLGPNRLMELRSRYHHAIRADPDFFNNDRAAQARFATLIQLSKVREIEPISFGKSDRNAWVLLSGPLSPKGHSATLHKRHGCRITAKLTKLS